MTTSLSFIASLIASAIPGLIIDPSNPATVLGFLVVGACLFLGARDYVTLRPVRAHRHH